MASDKEDRIRAKAHEIWLSEGSPEGSEGRHWEMAIAAIEAEDAAPPAEAAPAEATPTEPEATEPAATEPEATEPAAAEPAAAEPAPAAPKPKAPRKRAAPKVAAEGDAPAPAKRATRSKKPTPTA